MPNWVANHVYCNNRAVLNELRDFNRLVPMPLTLLKTEWGEESRHFRELLASGMSYQEIIKPENAPTVLRYQTDAQRMMVKTLKLMPAQEWARLAGRYYLCYKLYGQPDWYSWCLDNWGSCSNLSSFYLDHARCNCFFQTAWTHPHAFIETLSLHYPETELTVEFAEEIPGENAGRYTIRNGVRTGPEAFADGSCEAYEVGFALWGGEEDYCWDDNRQTYIPIDDDGEEDPDDTTGA